VPAATLPYVKATIKFITLHRPERNLTHVLFTSPPFRALAHLEIPAPVVLVQVLSPLPFLHIRMGKFLKCSCIIKILSSPTHFSIHLNHNRGEFFYIGIKVFNALPSPIKDISGNPKTFKVALKHYLLTHSFYSLDEFFNEQHTYVMFDTNYIVQILISIALIISIAVYLLFYNYYSS